MKKKIGFYKKLLDKHLNLINKDSELMDDYYDFCLNYVKENIIHCYNNKNFVNVIITELFKRGMCVKWKLDLQQKI